MGKGGAAYYKSHHMVPILNDFRVPVPQSGKRAPPRSTYITLFKTTHWVIDHDITEPHVELNLPGGKER